MEIPPASKQGQLLFERGLYLRKYGKCEKGLKNTVGGYVMTVRKGELTLEVCHVCSLFPRSGRMIWCTVTGTGFDVIFCVMKPFFGFDFLGLCEL